MSKQSQKNQVRISIMQGPLGYCLVVGGKDNSGTSTRIAGQMDGFGGSLVKSFKIDIKELDAAILKHSFSAGE